MQLDTELLPGFSMALIMATFSFCEIDPHEKYCSADNICVCKLKCVCVAIQMCVLQCCCNQVKMYNVTMKMCVFCSVAVTNDLDWMQLELLPGLSIALIIIEAFSSYSSFSLSLSCTDYYCSILIISIAITPPPCKSPHCHLTSFSM